MKTKYINDVGRGLTQVLMETDNAGAVQASYTYGNDLISMYKAGANSYYHYDGLGTVRLMTDDLCLVTNSYTYDGFGNSVSSVSSVANTYGFTGEQQYAEADNLVFLRARYYSPNIGRFISRDPILSPMQVGDYSISWALPDLISSPQHLHPYVYAQNNPIKYVDPSGLHSENRACHYACAATAAAMAVGCSAIPLGHPACVIAKVLCYAGVGIYTLECNWRCDHPRDSKPWNPVDPTDPYPPPPTYGTPALD
ncbi:MAG: RHS repeat-associated core domain-containing protein [Phycisphaerales bacterium]